MTSCGAIFSGGFKMKVEEEEKEGHILKSLKIDHTVIHDGLREEYVHKVFHIKEDRFFMICYRDAVLDIVDLHQMQNDMQQIKDGNANAADLIVEDDTDLKLKSYKPLKRVSLKYTDILGGEEKIYQENLYDVDFYFDEAKDQMWALVLTRDYYYVINFTVGQEGVT